MNSPSKPKMQPTRRQPRRTAKTNTYPNQTTFNFLALPGEIRNLIYHFALVDNPDLKLTYCDMRTFHINVIADPKPPAILQLCRQLRSEGMPMFYGAGHHFQLRFRHKLHGGLERKVLKYGAPIQRVPPAKLLQAFPADAVASPLGATLSSIDHITVKFTDPDVPQKWANIEIGFTGLGGEAHKARRTAKYRVGDDHTDWGDEEAVFYAYKDALNRQKRVSLIAPGVYMPRHGSDFRMVMEVVRTMQGLKERCPDAMAWVEATVALGVVPSKQDAKEEMVLRRKTEARQRKEERALRAAELEKKRLTACESTRKWLSAMDRGKTTLYHCRGTRVRPASRK